LQPDDAAARYALGQGHYSDGHFQRAEAEFREALKLGFDRPKGSAALASSLLLQGDFEKVLEESGSGSDWPADVVAELSALRGLALLGLARTADAERLFDRVLETHPQQTLALVGKARIAASRDNRDEAKRLGELVSRHGKSTSESLALRAQLRWVLDKADEARSRKQVEPGSKGNAASQVRE
jgi:Tfp pilus assembly protein PilF